MAPDEADVLVGVFPIRKGHERFLLLHDELEGAGVRLRGGGFTRVLELAFPIDREIALVERLRVSGQRHPRFFVFVLPLGACGESAVFLLEDLGVFALVPACSLFVVGAVFLHFVDEEERENLDSERAQPQLLVKMVFDGFRYLGAFNRLALGVVDGFAEFHVCAVFELDELATRLCADVAYYPAVAVVLVLIGFLVEVSTCADGDFLSRLPAAVLSHVNGELGGIAIAAVH